ncbi:MAG: 3,8-cyclase, partial [Clostridia bacterium]|nr:3,8-cyclase [Clostridia bacterium]
MIIYGYLLQIDVTCGGVKPRIRGVENLIGSLNQITGIENISLTTNGQLLAPMVDRLVENGLRRVNISIDSLKP